MNKARRKWLQDTIEAIEKAKIECARKHFEKISNGDYIYGVCNSYEKLLELVNS